MFSLAAIVHFELLSPPCTFPGIQIIRHSACRFFALSSTAGYLLSWLRQPSHPVRILSGILPDPFYLLPARQLPAHVTLVRTTTPSKHPNAVWKGNIYIFYSLKELKLTPLMNLKLLVLVKKKSNLKLQPISMKEQNKNYKFSCRVSNENFSCCVQK